MTLIKRYKHYKGGIYDVLGEGHIQSEIPLYDMDEVVIYRSTQDFTLWPRRKSEFYDGRFTAIAEVDVKEDPLGYDVLMDLMHKIVNKIRKGEDHQPLQDLREQLVNLYPEAEITVNSRWGR